VIAFVKAQEALGVNMGDLRELIAIRFYGKTPLTSKPSERRKTVWKR
jgi:hypothetical protein